jgi:hypothetical protein
LLGSLVYPVLDKIDSVPTVPVFVLI